MLKEMNVIHNKYQVLIVDKARPCKQANTNRYAKYHCTTIR